MCIYFRTSDDTSNREDLSESLQREGDPESKEEEEIERVEEEDGVSAHENITSGEVCVICEKKRKKVKGREQPLNLTESETIEFLKSYALQFDARNLLQRIEGKEKIKDIIMHHRVCKYSLRSEVKSVERKQNPRQQWHKKRDAHKLAFENVCSFVSNNVIQMRQSHFLSYCKELYRQYIKTGEFDVDITCEPYDLENRLLQSFPRKIAIVSLGHRKVIKPFDGHLVTNNLEDIEKRDTLNKAILILKSEIHNIERRPLPEKITVDSMIAGECSIPETILDFFSNLISSTKRRQRSSYRKRIAESLSEDLIFAATSGKIKPSKHITLGLTLKSLTNSKKIINIVNRFGHCASYTVLEELETESTLASVSNTDVCPENIKRLSNLGTGLAYNNFDRFVDTTSGKDTLHDTVGIVFQDVVDDSLESVDISLITSESENLSESSQLRKRRLRSMDAVTLELESYSKRPRFAERLEEIDSSLRSSDNSILLKYKKIDFTWMMSHYLKLSNTPAWVGYNSMIYEDVSATQKISYLTTINCSPTNNSVVLETLKQAMKAADECRQLYMEVTYDLAIAKVAFQIQSIEKPHFNKLFIHIGSFHIMMAFFKAIGKFIEGCGLTTIMVDSEILASGSVNSFLTGKHFNRCKRLHPLVSLALQTLHFESFYNSLNISQEKQTEIMNYLTEFKNSKSIDVMITNDSISEIFIKYEEHCKKTLQGEHGKTAQFYMIYINLIDYYLMLNRSIRLPDFKLFKYILTQIASIFFIFNQQNYSRYLVLYLDKLMKVEETHPGLLERLEKGSFGVKRTQKSFSRQPVDLTLEQTINADAANKLTGISYLTNSIAARQRWCKSHSIRSAIIHFTMERAGLRKTQDVSADLEINRMKKFTQHLNTFITHIHQNMNPFSDDLDKENLFNISTGKSVDENIENFLLKVPENGQKLREMFITECSQDHLRFERAIKKRKILTFADAIEKKKMNVNGKMIEVRMQRDLFGKLLRISLEKTLNIDKVLTYPLIPIPLSFCHLEGTICKTDKSVLLHILEKEVENHEPEKCDVMVFDGFHSIHSMVEIPVSFGNISKKILHSFTANDAKTIIITFDRYVSPSIKDHEHGLRGRTEGNRFTINGPDQKRSTNFRNDLKNIHFKDALVKFLCANWSQDYMSPYIMNKTIFVNYENCFKFEVINNNVIRTVEDDVSCPEHLEADTKIIFHICQLNFDAHVTIRCSDTDIIVIMLGNMHKITKKLQISILTGRENNYRYIDVTKIHNKLGKDFCRALPAFHAFTGCDYNPAFYRKGKRTPFKLLQKSQKYIDAFTAISEWSENKPIEHFSVLEIFVCEMYGFNSLSDVNLARLATFMKTYQVKENENILKKKCNFEGSSLPPCKSELHQHLLRTSYIAQMWTHASQRITSIVPPFDYGWQVEDGKYTFKWFDGEQLPKVDDITLNLSGICRYLFISIHSSSIFSLNVTFFTGHSKESEIHREEDEESLSNSSDDESSLECSDSENDSEDE